MLPVPLSQVCFFPFGNYGFKSEYDVPDDVFMIQELKLDALKHVEGVIKCQMHLIMHKNRNNVVQNKTNDINRLK
ncbi:MAG: hypothetical protein ACI810_002754 [Gammaproteobacteria bacterium]|jgi:hypothetical protein